MARIRTIKPEFWTHEELSSVSEPARLLAIGLLNLSDDEGYFKANPLLLKAGVFPLCEPSVSIQEQITELSMIGYIRITEGSDGKSYGHVVSFKKHQKVNRPQKSKIKDLCKFTPLCDEHETQVSDEAGTPQEQFTDDSLSDHEQFTGGKEGKGREGKGKEHDSGYAFCGSVIKLNQKDFDQWVNLYSNLDLMKELERLDLEMQHDTPKNWFVTVSNKLNYQNKNTKPGSGAGKADLSWARGMR